VGQTGTIFHEPDALKVVKKTSVESDLAIGHHIAYISRLVTPRGGECTRPPRAPGQVNNVQSSRRRSGASSHLEVGYNGREHMSPQNCPFSLGGGAFDLDPTSLGPHVNIQTGSRLVQSFLHIIYPSAQQRRAHHSTRDVCSNRPHLQTSRRRCGLNIFGRTVQTAARAALAVTVEWSWTTTAVVIVRRVVSVRTQTLHVTRRRSRHAQLATSAVPLNAPAHFYTFNTPTTHSSARNL